MATQAEHRSIRAHWIRHLFLVLGAAALPWMTGCATAPLSSAREAYYRGQYALAETNLTNVSAGNTDRVLVLMERGMIRQSRHAYRQSTRDWQEASSLGKMLDYYSISRGTTSFVVNDQVQAFRGAPFERTLLHSYSAKSYLALGMWDDAAVEARNSISRMENLYGFPDDPYSHYLSAACLELSGDSEGAAFQYRKTSSLLASLAVDDKTGRIIVRNTNDPAPAAEAPKGPAELICFVGIGRTSGPMSRMHDPDPSLAPYAEIYAGDKFLGRTYPLTSTGRLMADTEHRIAAMKATKTITRVVIKQAIAEAISQKNEALGQLVWFILFAMETPDSRHWDTLPEWLQAGRMDCPENLTSYRLVLKSSGGIILGEQIVNQPITRKGKTYVTFYRDLRE